MWALNKQQMYNGDPSPQVVDFSGDTSDFTVIPANSRLQTGTPPAGSPEYFVSTEQFLPRHPPAGSPGTSSRPSSS